MTTAAETTATKEEAAAIQAWAEALRGAQKTLSQAHIQLGSVRGSVLREIKLGSPARTGPVDIRIVNLIFEISKHRGEADRAAEKISSSVSDDDR